MVGRSGKQRCGGPVVGEGEHCALGAVLARMRVRRREPGETQKLLERPVRQMWRRAEAEAPRGFHLRDQAELQVPSPSCSMREFLNKIGIFFSRKCHTHEINQRRMNDIIW